MSEQPTSPQKVKVTKNGVQYMLPADQLGRAMSQGYFPVDEGGNVDRSWFQKGWDYVNKGLVTPNGVVQWATGGKESLKSLESERDRPPKLNESSSDSFSRVFHTGMMSDLSKTASSLTSPASLGVNAVAQMAKIPGAVGKAARALLAVQGVTYAGAGAKDVAEGLEEGVKTPEGARKVLSGSAQILGGAPAGGQILRSTEGAISRVMPGLFAREERAFVGALRPAMKDTPALRRAYQYLRGDLQQAKPKEFPELRDFAEKGRRGAAADLAGRIYRRSPTAGNIDAVRVGDAVRQRITPWMKIRTTPGGQLPPEAQMIHDEATNIEQSLLRNPMNLSQAEQVVQDINAELNKFRKLPPDAQYQAIRSGDPVSVMTAVKEALQDQIESKLSGYSDLKQRYGAFKEIQQQTERRMDQLDRESGNMDWATRRASENLGSMFGSIFSGQFLHGLTDIFAGRAAGDIAVEGLRRPERMLRRGVAPPPRRLPFAGQITQTVGAGQGDQ
jgi:hypothetical protein